MPMLLGQQSHRPSATTKVRIQNDSKDQIKKQLTSSSLCKAILNLFSLLGILHVSPIVCTWVGFSRH